MELNKKAIQYAKLNISLRSDTAQHYKAFLLLGNAYFKAGLYDSATIYINKSLLSTGYAPKPALYASGRDSKAQGDLDRSLALAEKHSLYLDSSTCQNRVTIFLLQRKK